MYWVCSIGDVGPTIFSNDYSRLTFTIMSRSNLLPYAFKWRNFEKLIFENFSHLICLT